MNINKIDKYDFEKELIFLSQSVWCLVSQHSSIVCVIIFLSYFVEAVLFFFLTSCMCSVFLHLYDVVLKPYALQGGSQSGTEWTVQNADVNTEMR